MRVKPHFRGRKLVAALTAVPLVVVGVATLGASSAVADPSEPVNTNLQCDDLVRPIDPDATPETVRLFQNMYYHAGEFMMYGHQEDQASNGTNSLGNTNPSHAYGVSAVYTRVQRYPGILGWDVGHIELKNDVADWGTAQGTGRPLAYANSNVNAQTGSPSAKWNYTSAGIDGIPVSHMVSWIKEGASWDGINTISIHSLNPVTYGVYNYNLYKPNTWTDHPGTATSMVLPGGELNARYQSWLDAYVDFANLLVDEAGNPIPIIWRPYHEHSGDWFWWGIDDMERGWRPAEIEEMNDLWIYTVDYFREHGVHNFLYAISPDRSRLGEPSYTYNDLVGNATLRALLDNYVDSRFQGASNAAVRTTAHSAISAYWDEVNDAGFDPTSIRANDFISLNYQAVPLDLEPTTGAFQPTVSTEFDQWMTRDPITGTSKFEDLIWRKWSEGFPGPDYVDVYGLDNYWENGGGHNYHPYRGAPAKLKEMFVASLDIIAKHAREDGKLVALTEGSFTGSELTNRVFNSGSDSFGDKYQYIKYTSYAMTWWGNVSNTSLSVADRDSGTFRWVSDAEVQPIDMAVPHWYTDEIGCYPTNGDIEVGVEIPEFPGGLALSFTSAFVALTDPALSADKAWITGGGYLPNVVIEDSRPGESLGWDATITAGPKLTGPQEVDGKALGITPWVAATAEGQVVTAGAGAAAWDPGFTAGTGFGSSPAGSSRGIAALSGWVSYKIPATVQAGSYAGVLSITVL